MKSNPRKNLWSFHVLLTTAMMVLFTSCPNSFLDNLTPQDTSHSTIGPTGVLTISISTSGDGSRSILPEPVSLSSVVNYNVSLQKSGSSDVVLTNITSLATPITGLSLGPWNLTLSGYDATSNKIFEGTVVVTISAGSNSASVVLLPVRSTEGIGTLAVDFSYLGPAGDIGQNSVSLVTYPGRISVDISTGVTSEHPGLIKINTSLKSGTYLLTINLNRDVYAVPVPYPPVSRIVQIFDNHLSSALIELTAADLTQPPAAPTNLRITGFDGTKLGLAWDDNSDVEDGFIINVNGTAYTVMTGTLVYADYPPTTDYIISVSAKNRYGNSPTGTLSYIAPTSITLDRETLVLGLAKTTQLTATISPNNATLASYLTWTSYNPSIASVNSTGLVFGVVGNLGNPVSIEATFPSSISSASASALVTVDAMGFIFGSGTLADPYQVNSIAELHLVRYALSSHFRQTSNLNGVSMWTPIGSSANPFTGSFNGEGHTLGLGVNSITTDPAGFFGTTVGATLTGIILDGINLTVQVTPSSFGALVGSAVNTTIYRCSSSGNISFAGSKIGGLVGMSNGGTISESKSSVNINGITSLGGLIGSSQSNIDDCYATGSVTGSGDIYEISGLAGSAIGGYIKNSYATGVSKQGLAGYSGVTCTSSYWDSDLSGTLDSYGGGTKKTTAEMILQSTYVDWDFTNIWGMGGSHPYLQWEGVPAPDTTPPLVNSITASTTNSNPGFAKTGDMITINFSMVEEGSGLNGIPSVTVGGYVTSVTGTYPNYTATFMAIGGMSQGMLECTIVASDVIGNTMEPHFESTGIIFDSENPFLTITSPLPNAVVSAGASFTIEGTASDIQSGISRLEVSVNSGVWMTATGTNLWQYLLNGPLSELQTFDIQVRAIDSAGNVCAPIVRSFSIGPYALGSTGPGGGIIFYDKGVFGDGWRYLEAAPSNWNGGADPIAQWKTSNTDTPSTQATVGTGSLNTYTILLGTEHPAAALCRGYTANSLSDWFLPSSEELNLLFLQKIIVGGFSSQGYWSSTQEASGYARYQHFGTGVPSNAYSSYTDFFVRPIRAF